MVSGAHGVCRWTSEGVRATLASTCRVSAPALDGLAAAPLIVDDIWTMVRYVAAS